MSVVLGAHTLYLGKRSLNQQALITSQQNQLNVQQWQGRECKRLSDTVEGLTMLINIQQEQIAKRDETIAQQKADLEKTKNKMEVSKEDQERNAALSKDVNMRLVAAFESAWHGYLDQEAITNGCIDALKKAREEKLRPWERDFIIEWSGDMTHVRRRLISNFIEDQLYRGETLGMK